MKLRNKIVLFAVFLIGISSVSARSWKLFEKVDIWKSVPQNKTSHSYIYALKPENVLGGEKNPCPETLNPPLRGFAAIIAPGGSYHHLDMKGEGWTTAEWFKNQGSVPFVMHYRISGWGFHHPAMLEDLQMTIKYVRENAEKYGIEKDKVLIIGFSAGGHLVTMGGAFSDRNELSKLGVETKESLKPDFVVPVYPVVSMQDDIGHVWSRKSLLTKDYTKELQDEFSMEMNIPSDMPPVYLVACEDDPVVIFENSVRLDKTLTEKNIPHVFARYKSGGHGFGMKPYKPMFYENHWTDSLLDWIISTDQQKSSSSQN